ncbi:MAG: MoaD/ThiS family protein [Chloroflexi bacterium]|nr:MoaD/ThiS family protein [Chloroflexota bacterium]
MEITVRFFASMREAVGTGQCTLLVPEGAKLDEMVQLLVRRFPALAGHESSWHFAVNQTHAEMDETLHPGDQVAVFPYMAGG